MYIRATKPIRFFPSRWSTDRHKLLALTFCSLELMVARSCATLFRMLSGRFYWAHLTLNLITFCIPLYTCLIVIKRFNKYLWNLNLDIVACLQTKNMPIKSCLAIDFASHLMLHFDSVETYSSLYPSSEIQSCNFGLWRVDRFHMHCQHMMICR